MLAVQLFAADRPLPVDINDSAFSIDDNRSKPGAVFDRINAANWFFYRQFVRQTGTLYEQHVLRHMDTAYLFGTDAVIVVGSGIDYTLYRFLDNTTRKDALSDSNTTVPAKSDDKNFFEEGIASRSSKNIEKYLRSQKEKTELPQQLYTSDKVEGRKTYLISQWFDDKNINDAFLDRSNHSYVRLRGGYAYDLRGDDKYIYSVTARLKIPRTQEKLDLIFGDETKNSSDLSLEGTEAERDNSIALGMNNILGLLAPVETRTRLGFSGIDNPYAKIAFDYEALFGHWLIVPQQVFKYSVNAKFEEWTNLTFSRRVVKEMIFSLHFQRSSETGTAGMDYYLQPALNFTLGRYGNFTPYLGIYGRSQEQPANTEGYVPKKGLYRYAAGLNWSKQASRRYIVYRLQPILSYDDQYGFRSNYYLKALLEFYFGLRD